jgi:CHAD domain-containing protein
MALIDELKLEPTTVSPVVDLLHQSGVDPGGYSSKVNVSLTSDMAAAEAVQRILKNLTMVMHQNLDGVREDIDTEFLHDFRVAVRRARSLLGQTKGVLKAETMAILQAHLKAMGAITGDVRDLDVYLLKKAAYVDQVPDALKPGVLQLFRTLQRKRQAAKNRMLKAMNAAEFKVALAALDQFVQSDVEVHRDATGSTPVGELARGVISKRYRRIIKKGQRISEQTPDEKLHELRIDGKKLRYLLEFFTSLFPADQMKRLIKQLKQLQDNLGDFNDLSIQQDFLTEYLETITPQTPQAVILAAATGGLITHLAMDQRRVRSDFLNVFAAFSSHENKLRFKTLFT